MLWVLTHPSVNPRWFEHPYWPYLTLGPVQLYPQGHFGAVAHQHRGFLRGIRMEGLPVTIGFPQLGQYKAPHPAPSFTWQLATPFHFHFTYSKHCRYWWCLQLVKPIADLRYPSQQKTWLDALHDSTLHPCCSGQNLRGNYITTYIAEHFLSFCNPLSEHKHQKVHRSSLQSDYKKCAWLH